jgi:hypothetical protein
MRGGCRLVHRALMRWRNRVEWIWARTDGEEVLPATRRSERLREDKNEVARSEGSYIKMHIQNGVSSFPEKDKKYGWAFCSVLGRLIRVYVSLHFVYKRLRVLNCHTLA